MPLAPGASKMYLGCVWERANTVALWDHKRDPQVGLVLKVCTVFACVCLRSVPARVSE